MDPFKILEFVGVAFWVTYLLLLIRENIWCWIFGIMASIITIIMFYHSKIYMEAALNVYYVAAGCYGWYYWAKARRNQAGMVKQKAPVVLWSWKMHLLTFVAAVVVSQLLARMMQQHTDSPRPYVDATLATFSFLATLMETRKVLTCWIYWIVVNVCLVGLQIDREIYLYAGLSAFYAIMSVPGFLRWRKSFLKTKA
ncbi:nicotinamide riboside transporter PnuC [Olivibacter sitiensis]|uniref:nicotinamide riboside transporter PnuC n=1 Tax=Olivibacter sitiensis TaxID=376470 RepID=UPI00040F6A7E|nr:nicotinamide riboside transporter PnuC [Olivibacter sitiensis]